MKISKTKHVTKKGVVKHNPKKMGRLSQAEKDVLWELKNSESVTKKTTLDEAIDFYNDDVPISAITHAYKAWVSLGRPRKWLPIFDQSLGFAPKLTRR